MKDAETLRCGHCGGPVWVKGYGAPEVCPCCRQPVWMSERLRTAFGRYTKGLTSVLQAFHVKRGADAKEAPRKILPEGALDWFLGVATLVAVFTCWLVKLNFPRDPWPEKIFTKMCALVCPVGILIYARYDARRKAGEAFPAGHDACPACGLRAETSTGGGANACGSCGADLQLPPGFDVTDAEVNDARRLRARMARFRRDRAGWYVGKNNSIRRPTSIALLFLISLLVVAIGGTLPPRTRRRSTDARVGVVFIVTWLGILGGSQLLLRRISRNAARWDRAATALRAELGGTSQNPLMWLDSVWAGPAPRDIVRWGLHAQVVGCRLNGYPVLFYGGTTSITLLLAAWTPEVSRESDSHPISSSWRDAPRPAAIVSELAASDFDVVVTPAGLIGTVCANSLPDFRNSPELLVSLAPAIRRIADLATAIRAQHVDKALFGTPDSGMQSDPDASSEQGNG
jgi:hypothetical protein